MKYALLAIILCIVGLKALVAFRNWRMTPEQHAAEVQAYEKDQASRPVSTPPVSKISNAELQSIIADVYHVETSRFIQPDLMWITLPPGSNIQKTCQAIANVWAHRSGLDYVRVESWNGSVRLGQGTVYNGKTVTP